MLGQTQTPAKVFVERAKDWRDGAVVYQIFVDRFAPSANLESKKALYAGKTLKEWSEVPKAGHVDPELGHWTHELEFWGGDLASVRSKLGYVKELGADVVYLSPIFQAPTNHKYDTENYFKIAPEFGTKQDLEGLIEDVHAGGMKLMLDGVFNHIGVTSPIFQEAKNNPASAHRQWFTFGSEYPHGYVSYFQIAGLPRWNVKDAGARAYLWDAPNSVVGSYLREGIDGWRLDVAYQIGPNYLADLTKHVHDFKPGAGTVGEVSGYPNGWANALDGVYNFFPLDLAQKAVNGEVSAARANQMLERMVADAGIDHLLKSWLLIDNQDTERMATLIPDERKRAFVRSLQFALPGCPAVYYGTELGMTGGGDPECRAPMRWDLVNDENKDLAQTRRLIAIRKAHPALRYGDYKALGAEKLIAFMRVTDQVRQAVVVVANPTAETVTETFPDRNGRFMSWAQLVNLFDGSRETTKQGFLTVTLKPYETKFLVLDATPDHGYSPYDRIP